ncbi:hypothetical protein GIY30_14205 [Gordonia sp. HNM0687]|uniref:Uncharacterized protein n=1 Tax=Gordonia mangrovi TaxID=2665643 RepID=A0A6L7GUZ8_9ACTN|nr:hypothetical protein [Gordonia mangrovi]MDY6810830.1 hypothetical protein [Actinomycetota bacterium]MXP22495.1 hypothetical protein [Gordonia mangrovi]UVF77630.1 hypothetical protein NWF22_20535 [Gordonia mangrovi]
MSHRIDRVDAELADLVERVGDDDLTPCLYFLAITVMSAVDAGDDTEVTAALTELRERGSVAPSARLQVNSLLSQYEQRAFAARRRGDHAARERAFFQARAINCVAHVIGADRGGRPARDRLRDAAYEGAVACRGPVAVRSVLTRYAG